MVMTDQPVSPETQQRAYKAAKVRAEALQGVLTHTIVFVVINTGLFLINAFTRGADGAWWFYWPVLGWGVALAIHVVSYAFPVFSPDWVERRAQRMMRPR